MKIIISTSVLLLLIISGCKFNSRAECYDDFADAAWWAEGKNAQHITELAALSCDTQSRGSRRYDTGGTADGGTPTH